MKKQRIIKNYKNTFKLYLVYSGIVIAITLAIFVYEFAFANNLYIADKMFMLGLTVFNVMFGFATFSYAQYVNAKHERKIYDEEKTTT